MYIAINNIKWRDGVIVLDSFIFSFWLVLCRKAFMSIFSPCASLIHICVQNMLDRKYNRYSFVYVSFKIYFKRLLIELILLVVLSIVVLMYILLINFTFNLITGISKSQCTFFYNIFEWMHTHKLQQKCKNINIKKNDWKFLKGKFNLMKHTYFNKSFQKLCISVCWNIIWW